MTKSEKIKAEIERRMKHFQKEKDALPITTETRTERFSLGARISMCEELLEYINNIPEDEEVVSDDLKEAAYKYADNVVAELYKQAKKHYSKEDKCMVSELYDVNWSEIKNAMQKCYIEGAKRKEVEEQPQPISVPFVRIVDDCVAKCWEPGGVCSNPHRDCINCPKNWNLGFNTYASNKIEGDITADPKDWHVTVKSKISENTTWNVDIKDACRLDVAHEGLTDEERRTGLRVVDLPEDAYKVTWTDDDSRMLSDCFGAVMAADWYPYDDKKDIVKWLCDKFGKTEDEILGVNDNEKEEQ